MSAGLVMPEAFAELKSKRGEPTWEIAGFFPRQGEWTEEEYLRLSTTHFVELNNGCLEILPMPGVLHQRIVRILLICLEQFVRSHKLGETFCAPLPVHLWTGQYREPDIVFLKPERLKNLGKGGLSGQPEGADLVMEVVSPGDENRQRDLVDKREAYARAGIPEYWIVDPETKTITVLVLEGAAYRVHGEFAATATATSALLAGFAVNVDDVFAAVDEIGG